MKITANRILTSTELKESRLSKQELKSYTKRLLAEAIAEKFLTLDNFYEERERGEDTEYTMEMIVFSRETFRKTMSQLMYALPTNEFERIRDIFINQI